MNLCSCWWFWVGENRGFCRFRPFNDPNRSISARNRVLRRIWRFSRVSDNREIGHISVIWLPIDVKPSAIDREWIGTPVGDFGWAIIVDFVVFGHLTIQIDRYRLEIVFYVEFGDFWQVSLTGKSAISRIFDVRSTSGLSRSNLRRAQDVAHAPRMRSHDFEHAKCGGVYRQHYHYSDIHFLTTHNVTSDFPLEKQVKFWCSVGQLFGDLSTSCKKRWIELGKCVDTYFFWREKIQDGGWRPSWNFRSTLHISKTAKDFGTRIFPKMQLIMLKLIPVSDHVISTSRLTENSFFVRKHGPDSTYLGMRSE